MAHSEAHQHSEAQNSEVHQHSEVREDRNTLGSMFASLTWPLFLGLGATAGFYWLIYRGPFHHPLVLRYFAELAYTDIAELTQQSVNNVGVTLLRARERLRRDLETQGVVADALP